jgi:hypothetical protein
MIELRDTSDLGPAEMDLLGYIVCIKCAALPLLLVQVFQFVPSVYKCSVLPPYLPCT